MELPEGVQIVRKPNGRRYYYWAPGRGTARAAKREPLGSDPTHPDFWTKLRRLTGAVQETGTFAALIDEYQASADFSQLRPATQKDYAFHLNRIRAAAGDRSVSALTKRDLYLWRDTRASTPPTANHAMAIMSGLLEFGVRRGYRLDNPAIGLKRLNHDPDGAHPWPEEGWRFVLERAPVDLRRMAVLGRASGQRRKDLVRLRPADRYRDGFNLLISKRRDKEHFLPLTQAEIREIDSWGVGKLDLYLKTPQQKPYTSESLGSRWDRWRESEDAKAIRDLDMTIHGLRAMAVCDRRLRGIPHQAISAELCMSLKQVIHYSRFIDQPALARVSRDQRERGQNTTVENYPRSIENSR